MFYKLSRSIGWVLPVESIPTEMYLKTESGMVKAAAIAFTKMPFSWSMEQ